MDKTKRVARHFLPTGVLAAEFAADEQSIYAACVDGVHELNLDNGESRKLYEHDSYVSGIGRVDHDRLLVTAGFDGQLKWFDLSRYEVVRKVKAHQFWSWDMAISPDQQMVATVTGQYLAGSYEYEPRAESEPSLRIIDAVSGEILHSLPHVPSVQAVAFSPDSRYVVAANIMGEIRIWNAISGDLLNQWTTPDFTSWGIIKSHCYIGGIFALQFTTNGEQLLAAGMGPMRDPMAGNGKQLWQKFAWREQPARKIDETHNGQNGEGLMETLCVDDKRGMFLMGGRLRGGKWNAAVFQLDSGDLVHSLNTGFRMTDSRLSHNRDRLILAGCDKQKRHDGRYPPWGVVEVHELG